MTKETFQMATRLNHDLATLKEIKGEQEKKHWVGFRDSNNPSIEGFCTAELQNDFREFIDREIEKVNRIFDEL